MHTYTVLYLDRQNRPLMLEACVEYHSEHNCPTNKTKDSIWARVPIMKMKLCTGKVLEIYKFIHSRLNSSNETLTIVHKY